MHSYFSQSGTIIRGFQDMPCPLKVSFFQMSRRYFVWYKAWSRINELEHEGLIERLPVDEIGSKWQHFALYQLTGKGEEYKVAKPTLIERIKHYFF